MKRLAGALALFGLLLCPLLAAAQQGTQSWGPATSASVLNTVSPPASIASLSSWTSGCQPASKARSYNVFAALAAAGTASTQRYADVACTQPVGLAVPSTALALTNGSLCPSASYCGNVANNDGQPFLSMTITIANSTGSTNAVVAVVLVQGAE